VFHHDRDAIEAHLTCESCGGWSGTGCRRMAPALCEDGVAAARPGQDWTQVQARLSRLRGRINAATKKPPASPYNTREAHRSRFVKP